MDEELSYCLWQEERFQRELILVRITKDRL